MPANAWRVNCGSSRDVVDGLGRAWLADRLFEAGSEWGALGGNTVLREADLPIRSRNLGEILRSERHGLQGYRFKVAPGLYTVRVYAAETFEGDVNFDRAFGIALNGQAVAESFMPYRVAGGFACGALVEGSCRVTGGDLEIAFLGKRTIANGIEIEPAAAVVPPRTAAVEEVDLPRPPAAPTGARTTRKVLFIGNSGTFYWDLPKTLAALVLNAPTGLRLETEMLVSGGKTFKWHWEREGLRERIATGGFDCVVLQDGTQGVMQRPDETREFGARLIEAVRASGAEPLLFAYFGPEAAPTEAWDEALNLYLDVARRHEAALAPGGAALRAAMLARPEVNYHNPDRRHSGMHGAYLFASCFYRVMSGLPAAEHPYPAVLGSQVPLPRELARFLGRTADEACARYRPWTEILAKRKA
ncbi:MAG: malectin [Planctomycetota bacterium]|nr:malectin [Planctomycetota bacterium]